MAVFSDDFNRADLGNLGANWANASNGFQIISNTAAPTSAAGLCITYYSAGSTASATQFAQMKVSTSSGTFGAMVRNDGTANNAYVATYNGATLQIYKIVAGAVTAIATSGAFTINVGDIIRTEASGSTIKNFVNGVQQLSVTDTSLPGAAGNRVGMVSNLSLLGRFDDWSGGDIGSPGLYLPLGLA